MAARLSGMFVSLFRNAATPFLVSLALAGPAWGQETWAFEPERDAFSEQAFFDLRSLNEEEAGESGWVGTTPEGGFVDGAGRPLRFWALNTTVEREKPYNTSRPDPGWHPEPDIGHAARWLAKRGANLVRVHAFLNPDPGSQAIEEVDRKEVEWAWRTVGAMKKEGIYTVISPYWANAMESDDGRWGTDWEGRHHGLLFFEETLQEAYKEWLRVLFTTPTDYLGGKTLAEEPALAVFLIQNEDSFLFWTVNNLPAGPKRRLGERFGDWAKKKYGSLEAAYAIWGSRFSGGDDPEAGVLGFANVWELTSAAMPRNRGEARLEDQLAFWTETMRAFNREIARFVREDFGCPVLVNAGNWKTADNVLLNDAERYSYTVNDVIAVNRFFGGIHVGDTSGWAIENGHKYTNASVLIDDAKRFPLALKQVAGMPMMLTESVWVLPGESGFESPLLVSAYSSLLGIDAYFWFSNGTDEWVQPRSANGWLPSQEKWTFMSPDVVGQWPAAALAFRRGYVAQGEPVVEEARSLASLWQRKSPLVAESATFDPNRDTGDLPDDSPFEAGVDPLAFFVGPVLAHYGRPDAASEIRDGLEAFIQQSEAGAVVSSVTGELELDTIRQRVTVDAPRFQGVATHQPGDFQLGELRVEAGAAPGAVMAVSLDERPLRLSQKILVQIGSPARPTGWETEPTTIDTEEAGAVEGLEVADFGGPPWQVRRAAIGIALANPHLRRAYALDENGLRGEELTLTRESGEARLTLPPDALYVGLEGGESYEEWAASVVWDDPEADADRGADPDGDGLTNLEEFAMGLSPLRPDSGVQRSAAAKRDGPAARAAFVYRRNPGALGVDHVVETSSDLRTWREISAESSAAAESVYRDDADGNGAAELVEASVPWEEGETRKFFRLRVVEKN